MPLRARSSGDDPGNLGVLDGDGRALLVGVVAAPVLLAVAARLAEEVADRHVALVRVAGGREALAARPGDVEPGEVGHLVGAEREAEGAHRGIDLGHGGAVLEHLVGGLAVGHEHPVGDEAVAHLGADRDLAEAAGERERGRDGGGRGLLRHHDLEKPHHVRGREEVEADHVRRREVPAARRSTSR
jgi:hypothetical protein